MLNVEWRSTAIADLLAIIEYIADDNVVAAQNLKDEIEDKAAMLARFPKLGRIGRVSDTRELVVTENYIVVYQEVAKSIQVLRILHAAQQWP